MASEEDTMTQIDDVITTYLSATETEGKSPRTVKSYRESLADFRRVGQRLGFPDDVRVVEVAHVYAFLAYIRGRRGRIATGISPAYQNHHHRSLKAFFSWCQRMDYLDPERRHVFARVPLARVEKKVPRPFSKEEFEQLLASCDRSRLTGCRNYARSLFLLDNGIRAQECVTVRLDEVDWERRRVLVHGKGAKQRWVGIGERTAAALHDYIDRFRGERAGALFLTGRGEAMVDAHTLYVLMTRMAERAGLEKANPHRFRYSFATWAIASGAREIDVQLLLGHSSPQMTQHYAQAYDSEQAVEAHAALSPVAQLESTRDNAAPPAMNGRSAEDRPPELLSSPLGVSDVGRSEAGGASIDAPPILEEERMTTTKSAIKAGLTLVAKYKGEQYTCDVVEHDERLYFVRPKGEVFTSPSAAGKAITGTATNGYRFWSVPDKAPAGHPKRQKKAQAAVAAAGVS
jgi:site-specific recombinase XerD